jgi:N-acetyl-alpha-D-glucosaminyl L-malate synthase BshA
MTDRIKVCIVTTSFTTIIEPLVNKLSLESKYEMHVIYLDYPGIAKDKDSGNSLLYLHPIKYSYSLHSLAVASRFECLRLIPLLANMLREIRRVVKNYNINLINAHWAIPSGFLASLGCRKIPLITTVRGADINKFGGKRFFKYPIKYALMRSAKIIAVSSDLKQNAINLGAQEENIHIMPRGIDLNKFKPMDKQAIRAKFNLPNGFLVLFAGNLIKVKRVDRLIRVTAKLSRDLNIHVLIVGNGPERANLENLAKSLGLENILFIGRAPYDNMPFYMAASDILVLASESEGLPGCVQEAMACGTPVVASNVGGLAELITNGVNGYLVDNEAEMEERMRLLMSSPELVQTMGANALEFARQNLSLDMVVKKTEELYASILKQKP